MRARFLTLVPVFLLVVSCTEASHPLAGNWAQYTGSDAKGMSLTFDTKGTALTVHLAPRADGTHDHLHDTTYTFDVATKTVTVKAKLMGEGRADTWTGKVDGNQIELSSADGNLRFRHGGDAGH